MIRRRSPPPLGAIDDAVGAPDGLVHNAGVAAVGSVEEMPLNVWQQIFSTNLFGPVQLTKELLPAMRAAGRGRIVVVSSAGAVRGMPAISAYSASKGALERWAEALAQEIAPFGLGVTILVAGTFKTDILTLTRTYGDPNGPYAAQHDGLETSGRRFLRFARSPERFAPALAEALDEESRSRGMGSASTPGCCCSAIGCCPTSLFQRVVVRALGVPTARYLAGRRTTGVDGDRARGRQMKGSSVADSHSIDFESRMLIDGKLAEGESGTFTNINPATEEVLGEVADASKADMHRAIDAARRAFDETDWSTNRALAAAVPPAASGCARSRAGGPPRGADPRGRLPAHGDARPAARRAAGRGAPLSGEAHRGVPVGDRPRRRDGQPDRNGHHAQGLA